MSRVQRVGIWVFGLLLAGALGIWGLVRLVPDPFEKEHEKYRSALKLGLTPAAVESALGKPFRVYTRENAPKEYYVKGYGRKERPITNKVYIYMGTETIAYVYFDNQEKVEDFFVGGS